MKWIGTIALAAPTEVAAPAVTVTAFQRPPAVETETFLLNCNAVALNASSFKLTVTDNVAVAPDGRTTACTLQDASTGALGSVSQLVSVAVDKAARELIVTTW